MKFGSIKFSAKYFNSKDENFLFAGSIKFKVGHIIIATASMKTKKASISFKINFGKVFASCQFMMYK